MAALTINEGSAISANGNSRENKIKSQSLTHLQITLQAYLQPQHKKCSIHSHCLPGIPSERNFFLAEFCFFFKNIFNNNGGNPGQVSECCVLNILSCLLAFSTNWLIMHVRHAYDAPLFPTASLTLSELIPLHGQKIMWEIFLGT